MKKNVQLLCDDELNMGAFKEVKKTTSKKRKSSVNSAVFYQRLMDKNFEEYINNLKNKEMDELLDDIEEIRHKEIKLF